MKIFINSYTYIYDRHLRMFDFFPHPERLVFILPHLWKAKGGKLIIHPPTKTPGMFLTTWAPFYHSHYPVIRGMLKGWMPATGRILRKLARAGDVLLSSAEPNLLTAYLYARLARRRGLKHVFLTWQNIPYRQRLSGLKLKITEWIIRQVIKNSSGGLFGTEQSLAIHRDYIPANFPVAIVPQSGVDVDLFAPGVQSDFRERFGLHGKVVYLFGAVFDERKGVFTTIQAFKETLAVVPNGHLVMIGIGKLWQAAKKMAADLGLEQHITFLEWMPNEELPGVFASVDMLVHPSEPFRGWEEQYGWTILQAQSSGLPVVATTIGAIGEAVKNGETGILVPPRDVPALAHAMIALAQNPDRRREMGRAGRAHILAHYDHRVIAQRLAVFLESLP